jgi:hypothetical protein
MTVLLCFPASVFAKGPNVGVPAGYKLKNGPKGGVLFLGWIEPENYPTDDLGVVEAVLYLDGYTYYGIYDTGVPESRGAPANDGFKQTTPVDITGGNLPCEIIEDFGVAPVGTCAGGLVEAWAVVFEESDVSDFQTSWDPDSKYRESGLPGNTTYKWGVSCVVDISFLVPTKK